MTKPKLTPWFPGTVKPALPGVYERRGPGLRQYASPRYARWNGKKWFWSSDSIAAAGREGDMSPAQDGQQWRGLAEKP